MRTLEPDSRAEIAFHDSMLAASPSIDTMRSPRATDAQSRSVPSSGPGSTRQTMSPSGRTTTSIPRYPREASASATNAIVSAHAIEAPRIDCISGPLSTRSAPRRRLGTTRRRLGTTRRGLGTTRIESSCARRRCELTRSWLGATRGGLATTRRGLGSTRRGLGTARIESSRARRRCELTRSRLGRTRGGLATTRRRLGAARIEFARTRRRCEFTRSRLGSTRGGLATTRIKLGRARRRCEVARGRSGCTRRGHGNTRRGHGNTRRRLGCTRRGLGYTRRGLGITRIECRRVRARAWCWRRCGLVSDWPVESSFESLLTRRSFEWTRRRSDRACCRVDSAGRWAEGTRCGLGAPRLWLGVGLCGRLAARCSAQHLDLARREFAPFADRETLELQRSERCPSHLLHWMPQ